jgi:hypothetical protein
MFFFNAGAKIKKRCSIAPGFKPDATDKPDAMGQCLNYGKNQCAFLQIRRWAGNESACHSCFSSYLHRPIVLPKSNSNYDFQTRFL